MSGSDSEPPRGPWVLAMCWTDLLFAHWRVAPEEIAAVLPEPLVPDVFDGSAWLGVVPFSMTIRPRWVPALPGVSSFPEINLRTYVTIGGKPGVYFFSLDASSRVAVRAARGAFRLPYFDAEMAASRSDDGWVLYSSRRTHRGAPSASFVGRYRPIAGVKRAASGGLEHFLTERYALFTVDSSGRPRRGDIVHEPWPLQPAEWDVDHCDMTSQIGIAVDGPPLLHFASRVEVRAWLPRLC